MAEPTARGLAAAVGRAVADGVLAAEDRLPPIRTVAAHLRFGDRVAVEQPAFPPLLDLLDAAGVAPVPVRIDERGPVPGELASAVRAGVRAVFLQPRAQNPTGASLTPDRLAELAAVLQAGDALLVEDDSAGPIATTPALSLGSALPERTLHVRSYSKSHGPDLRLAAIGGPAALVDPLVERRFLGQGWTSRLLQALLVDLLTHAPSLHAVARARRTYARRRTTVAGELARLGVDVWRGDGINMWLPVRDEAAALLLLATRGIGAAPGGPFQLGSSDRPHLRVTVGLVASGHREVAAALADAAAAGARPAPPR
jgi:DNA-binding transcriptional MocR family regulator